MEAMHATKVSTKGRDGETFISLSVQEMTFSKYSVEKPKDDLNKMKLAAFVVFFPQESFKLKARACKGCDGSLLLDQGEGNFTTEKEAPPNNGSVRGFEVIDSIKAQLEKACPGVVSCADILAVAARDAVVQLGGASWGVPLGRKDATSASQDLATLRLPSPDSNLAELIGNFSVQGLSEHDMIVLSGGHTIGKARCLTFSTALYQDSNIDPSYAASLKGKCPNSATDATLFPIDVQTENVFDNDYYKNLIQKRGLFRSDRVLYNGGSADSTVACFAHSQNKFFKEFGISMIKMGRIQPAAGTKLEVRRNCRKPNSVA